MKEGLARQATDAYVRAGSFNHSDAKLHVAIASSLTSMNEPGLAIVSYAKAVELLPTSAAAAFNHAELLFAVGHYKEASEMYARSADLFSAQLGEAHARTRTAKDRQGQSMRMLVMV